MGSSARLRALAIVGASLILGLASGCGANEENTVLSPDASIDAGRDATTTDAPSETGREAEAAACTSPNTDCGGDCVDPKSNIYHCGGCNNPCFGVTQCVDGVCLAPCAPDQMRCLGKCVPTATDNSNCGQCGKVCETGKVCSKGTCSLECATPLVTCYEGETSDGGTDADADADADADDGGTEAGDAADAADASDASDASDATIPKGPRYCADLVSDEANCGRCGEKCKPGEQCASGVCQPACAVGQTDCGGTCRDLTTDLANCGRCDNACTSGLVCSGSACQATCAPPFSKCGNRCANTATDRDNCGTCSRTCTGDELCLAGDCRIPCPGAQTLCSDKRCHDLTVDDGNCGACSTPGTTDRACPAGETCVAGKCSATCKAPLSPCGAPAKCVDRDTDSANCGVCGNACTGGSMCVGAACMFMSVPPSILSPDATGTYTAPRPVSFQIATATKAKIYWTTDGAEPTPGAATTFSADDVAQVGALANGVTLKWYADYGPGIGREATRSVVMSVSAGAQTEAGAIYEGLTLNGTGPIVTVAPGTTVTGTVNQQVWNASPSGYCPTCVRPFSVGVESVGHIQDTCQIEYASEPYPGAVAARTFTFTAPTTPGRYFVRQGWSMDYSCYYVGGQIIGEVIVK
jgi:hypothetical protein